MKVIFAASDALTHWLDVPLPRLNDEHKRLDKGLLVSDKTAVSWQVYLVPHGCVGAKECLKPLEHGQKGADLIFIGAYSRYTVICPNIQSRAPEDIEHEFKSRLTAEVAQLMVTLGGSAELVEHCAATIENMGVYCDWHQYAAPNIQPCFLRAKAALEAFYGVHASGRLNDETAYEMGLSLNTLPTSAQILTADETVETFIPVERLLGDWLIRFGDGAHALVREHQKGEMLRILNQSEVKTAFLSTKIQNLRATKVAPVDVYRRRKALTSNG